MANNRTSTILLEYRIQKQSTEAAIKTTRRLADEIAEMREEMASIERAGKMAGKGIDDAFNRSAVSNASKLTKEIREQEAALKQARKSVRDYNDEFDNVSRNVGLAGDVQSNLGAVSGLAGAAGAGGLGQGIGVAGEVAVLAEELPRLKASLTGMPSTIQNAVQALGAGGLVAGGGLLAGIALLGVAFNQLEKNAQKARERTEAGIAVQERYIDAVNTLTTGEAQALITQLQTEQEARRQLREQLEQDLLATGRDITSTGQLLSSFGAEVSTAFAQLEQEIAENGTVTAEQFAEAMRQAGTPIAEVAQLQRDLTAVYGEGGISADVLRQTISALGTEYTSNENLIRLLTGAVNDNTFAARDAAAAEAELTSARLAEASAAADSVRLQSQLNQQSTQALIDRQNAIAAESAAIATEISALRASGDEAEVVTKRIDELTSQLSTLGAETQYITDTALEYARAREAQADADAYAKRQAEETAQTVQQYNDDVARINQQFYEQRARLEQQYADQQIKIAQDAVDAANKALADLQKERDELTRDLGRDEAEAMRDLQRDQIEIAIDAQRDERDSLRDHLRNLQRIRENAADEEFTAILNRDFAGLFASRRQTNQALADASDEFAEERADRQQALAERRADLMVSFQQDREDRIAKYQQDLSDAQMAYQAARRQIESNQRQALQDAQNAARQEQQALRSNLSQQLQARQQAAASALQMIRQTEQQRVSIMAQAQNALIQQGNAMLQAIAMRSAGRAANNVNNVSNRTLNANVAVNGGNPDQVQRVVIDTINRIF